VLLFRRGIVGEIAAAIARRRADTARSASSGPA
jgi:hypothetical protein